jgi:hypothetical protein
MNGDSGENAGVARARPFRFKRPSSELLEEVAIVTRSRHTKMKRDDTDPGAGCIE